MEACPKCNFALTPDALECPACGVILAKLKAGLQHQPRPVSAPVRSNPYAPPVAQVEDSSVPPPLPVAPAPVQVQEVITPLMLSAFETMRPWLRFMVVYSSVMIGLVFLAAFGLLVFGLDKPEMMPIALFYFVYGGIGLAVLLPLHRSSQALGRLSFHGASACLETFALEQSSFWRRIGVICAVSLAIIGIGVVVAFLAGAVLSGFVGKG